MNPFHLRLVGFTLVEIMIVVAIISIIAAIAIPNFVKHRMQSRAKACVANLKRINDTVQQWALETKKTNKDKAPATNNLPKELGAYLKGAWSTCPTNGKVYAGGFLLTALPVCPNYNKKNIEFSSHILP
jgi:prepilin-type N-terminal cleavage/methylation domain-containing protein